MVSLGISEIKLDDGILGATCYSQRRGVFVTLGHKLFSETVLQFCKLVTKVPTITTEGADNREILVSYRGKKQDPPGYLL